MSTCGLVNDLKKRKKLSLFYTTCINAVIRLCVENHEFPSANYKKNSFAEASSYVLSRNRADAQRQGTARGPTTRCSTGTTNSRRGSHCFPWPKSHSSPVTPWAAPPTSPTLKCRFLHTLWVTCAFIAVPRHGDTRVNNSPSTQQARLALVLPTIYSSGSRNRDCKGSAESSTFKVITSHFPTILLENIALRCCSCSPPPLHVHNNSFLPQ